MRKLILSDKLITLFFYFSIILFLLAFNFSDNPVGNWYQQFMPNLNGAFIRDITFTDSLNGYAVTSIGGSNSYILKTTNGGDNWTIKFMHTQPFVRVEFINGNTGFTNAFQTIYKTTDAGDNWNPINLPGIFGDDMFALNEDTIWLAMSESLTGGVWRTTNGGASWQNQGSYGSYNPDHIYMFNARIGFHTRNLGSSSRIYKTTDSGGNWSIIVSNDYFNDMYFADSLTGWKCSVFGMKKSTDGGFNWVVQPTPSGGNFVTNAFVRFSNINRDTIWGVGGSVLLSGNRIRGVLYRTTDGGNSWAYQIPDTAIALGAYQFVDFVNRLNGWANPFTGEIHTTMGGDTTFITSIKEINWKIPKEFILYQNYPNPFNNKSNIKYQISKSSFVELRVFDITGKLVTVLVEQKQSPGLYQADFEGNDFSSGVYFYSLFVYGNLIDTKKMILIK